MDEASIAKKHLLLKAVPAVERANPASQRKLLKRLQAIIWIYRGRKANWRQLMLAWWHALYTSHVWFQWQAPEHLNKVTFPLMQPLYSGMWIKQLQLQLLQKLEIHRNPKQLCDDNRRIAFHVLLQAGSLLGLGHRRTPARRQHLVVEAVWKQVDSDKLDISLTQFDFFSTNGGFHHVHE